MLLIAFIALLLVAGSVTRSQGVAGFDLWGTLVEVEPASTSFGAILLQNIVLWVVLYGGAYLALYFEPGRSMVIEWKLNPSPPPKGSALAEAALSLRGLAIVAGYELAMAEWSQQAGWSGMPPHCPAVLCSPYDTTVRGPSLGLVTVAGLLLYLWGDTHFYWTHRLLHTPWLYRNVHKVHHKSFNPNPFSGLSMHWFEQIVYFSAAPLISWCAPWWLTRALCKGLIVFPLEGHWGFGSWSHEPSYNHYIHHAKFNWNFGSSPLWDHICGTNWSAEFSPTASESKKAQWQADLVNFRRTSASTPYSRPHRRR